MSEEKIKFKIEPPLLNSFVEAINSTKESMRQLKKDLIETKEQNQEQNSMFIYYNITTEASKRQKKRNQSYKKQLVKQSKSLTKNLKSIQLMYYTIAKNKIDFPREKEKILTDTIKQIMKANNGIITTRMISSLDISRQYLVIMINKKVIERVSRGIYCSTNAFIDSYFSFQQKYKKTIFSHMNALYFYGLTEEFPSNYTVTVPQNYHDKTVNKKCNVFYVSNDLYEMGVTEVKTPYGNKVRVYDKERSICDIVKAQGRMDYEQVKKTLKQYIKDSDKDLAKLTEYSKKMGINKKIMEIVGELNYD